MFEATDIKKSYAKASGTLEVLRGINLSIKTGEIVAIVGPSGAGKSTLLHILGGLDRPNSGTVFMDGQDLYRLKDAARAKIRNEKIGFVFQFYHLLPEFTALENVILPLLVKEDSGRVKKFHDKGQSLLKQVGLEERILHKPAQLSGGEQQRVAIARALVNEPSIIFCDEPTGNLDSVNSDEIINLLLNLNKQNNQTVVIVTHNEETAQRAHRTLYIRDGQLITFH